MANILYQDKYGWTTLTTSVMYNAPTDIITLLINKGGNKHLVMMKVHYGWSLRGTALHLACEYGTSVKVVNLFLDDVGGVELLLMKNMKSGWGDTALLDSIANKTNASEEVIQILKDAITSLLFNKYLQSTSPNSLNLRPLLELCVEVHGIDGLFTKFDDTASPLVMCIAESNESIAWCNWLHF